MTSDGHIWHSESSPALAVVIPAWNERENIELLLPALKEMVADLGLKAEIIVLTAGRVTAREPWQNVGAHVALRNAIYLFPHEADRADYVVVDVSGLDYVGPSPDPEAFRPLLRRLVETRPLITVEDGLALFGRGEPSADTVVRLVNLRHTSAADAESVGQFLLVAHSVTPTQVAPRANFQAWYSWSWILRAASHAMPCVAEALVSNSGDPVWESRRPMFHGLLSAEHWAAGMVADDQAVFVLAETVPPGRYAWVVATWLDEGPDLCRVKPQGAAGLAVAEVQIRPW